MSATIISIVNLKGGVGKSTLTMIFAEYLSLRFGKRVLLIDMDAQGNLSYCMMSGANIDQQYRAGRTLYHFFKRALVEKTPNIPDYLTRPPLIISNVARSSAANYPGVLDIIVSNPSVAQLDEDLLSLWESGKPMPSSLRNSLSEALQVVRADYDYVLIDCPPGLSLFSSSALIASDYFVSPIIPEPLSLQGVALIQHTATELNAKQGTNVQFAGVILNIVKHYRKTHHNTAAMIYDREMQRYQPFRYWLPDNEKLRKLGDFDPDLGGPWAAGADVKFTSAAQKYSLTYRLRNPVAGPLRRDEEDTNYRLEDRIESLVGELIEKCQ